MKKIDTTRALILTLALVIFGVGAAHAEEVTRLEDFTGQARIYLKESGISNDTVVTDTEWVTDTITVETENSDSDKVLDQFVNSNGSGTIISRNAIFIGNGSIETDTVYKGSNFSGGEDSRTGILIEGSDYGVLIQNGSLRFDSSFGGMDNTVAMGTGNYTIEQYAELGTLDSTGSFVASSTYAEIVVTGSYSGTFEISKLGSAPTSGTDPLYMVNNGWVAGRSPEYSFVGSQNANTITVDATMSRGNLELDALFESLEARSFFEVKGYM